MIESHTKMLSPWDDYWLHQADMVMEDIAVDPIKDKLWLEQSWFGFFNREQGVWAGFNLTSHPHVRTIASYGGISTIAADGAQEEEGYAASREIFNDRADMQIGPLKHAIIEPLKKWSLKFEKNDFLPFSFDLECEALSAPKVCFFMKGAPLDVPSRDPICGDDYRAHDFQQALVWNGSLEVKGKTYDVKDWIGARDRSWGNKGLFSDTALHIWIVAHFKDFHLSLWHKELPDGRLRSSHGVITYANGDILPITQVEHYVTFDQGSRRPTGAKLRLLDLNGKWHLLEAFNIPDTPSSGGSLHTALKVVDDPLWLARGTPWFKTFSTDSRDLDRVKAADRQLRARIADVRFDGGPEGLAHFELMISLRYGRYRDQIASKAT